MAGSLPNQWWAMRIEPQPCSLARAKAGGVGRDLAPLAPVTGPASPLTNGIMSSTVNILPPVI